jgi:hypothetical protein
MSSLLKLRPGIRPRFFNQKMLQKLPLKKMPSTAAKATRRSAKLPLLDPAQRPIGLLLHAVHGVDGVQELVLLHRDP